jgi:hypothetical protein
MENIVKFNLQADGSIRVVGPANANGREIDAQRVECTIGSLPSVEMVLGKILRTEKELAASVRDREFQWLLNRHSKYIKKASKVLLEEIKRMDGESEKEMRNYSSVLTRELLDAQQARRDEVSALLMALMDHTKGYALPSSSARALHGKRPS